VLLQLLEQCRVEVVPVRQLAPVQLLEGPRLDLLAEEMVGRHHHVVAAAAGQQLALEGLVRIEDVVDGLDAGLLLERFQCRLADVVRPVVDMYVGSLGANGSAGRGGDDERLQCRAHGWCPLGTGRVPSGERRAVYWKNLEKSTTKRIDDAILPVNGHNAWEPARLSRFCGGAAPAFGELPKATSCMTFLRSTG